MWKFKSISSVLESLGILNKPTTAVAHPEIEERISSDIFTYCAVKYKGQDYYEVWDTRGFYGGMPLTRIKKNKKGELFFVLANAEPFVIKTARPSLDSKFIRVKTKSVENALRFLTERRTKRELELVELERLKEEHFDFAV